MKKTTLQLTLIITTIIASVCAASASFSRSDFIIVTKGLSETYAKRFKDSTKIEVLVKTLNEMRMTQDIAPIKITVSYNNNEGEVLAEINYNATSVYYDYERHNRGFASFGKGISVAMQGDIFTALDQYKQAVAQKDWGMDEDILKFENTVKLKRLNGDWASFYSYNSFDSRGFYLSDFYTNARISIAGKVYTTETTNAETLNENHFFYVDKIEGLDGNKTAAYYFCKFFNIQTE